jgi:hypothetical protein
MARALSAPALLSRVTNSHPQMNLREAAAQPTAAGTDLAAIRTRN